MSKMIFEPDFWTQRIKIFLFEHTFCLIYLLNIKLKNRKSRFGLKPEVRPISKIGQRDYTKNQSQIILIPNFCMFTSRRHRDLVPRFQVRNALQHHHVMTCTSYYYGCAQFFMHIQIAYTEFIRKKIPKTL